MKQVAVVLAAGAASRFGSVKQLAKVGNKSLINHTLEQYLSCDFDAVMVVLGANYPIIKQQLVGNVTAIYCPDWQNGMAASIAAGIVGLDDSVSHVVIGLGDQVGIDKQQLSELINLQKQYGERIIASKYAGQLGAPASFPRRFFVALQELQGDQGAKGIIKQNVDEVVTLALESAQFDIDYPQDLTTWLSKRKT